MTTEDKPRRRTRRSLLVGAGAGLLAWGALGALGLRRGEAQAQEPVVGEPLRSIGEIRSANGRLQAVLGARNAMRILPGDTSLTTLRHFWGRDVVTGALWPPPGQSQLMNPGPTLRARIGDFVEIAFFNSVDVSQFPSDGLDRGETGGAEGCESTRSAITGEVIYPIDQDTFPNCFHGSSTANVHFHGFHVSPDGLADNVLLKVRPSLVLEESDVEQAFATVFERTRRGDTPPTWDDLPVEWKALQEGLLAGYDDTAVWQGEPGALPTANRLLPMLKEQVSAGQWPQYAIGAHAFSFRITPTPIEDASHHPHEQSKQFVAGQAPGTHWYHTHVHGSTAINMYHGMAGVFVIEGESYDDKLRAMLPGLLEKVLILQQCAEYPGIVVDPNAVPQAVPVMVNGQMKPTLVMRPGEVQLWRLVNGTVDAVGRLNGFQATDIASAVDLPEWSQTAQDGVQFDPATFGAQPFKDAANPLWSFAPGNRIDILVRAPTLPTGQGSASFDLAMGVDTPRNQPRPPRLLLTLVVEGPPLPMTVPTPAEFPARPAFLADLEVEPPISRRITFSEGIAGPQIDGGDFEDGQYDQTMVLGDTEDWTLRNATNTAAHPFHIHVNPFQVLEVFDPSLPEAQRLYCPPSPRPWQDTVAVPRQARIGSVQTPGYVKIRHRFDDFAGSFVLHCHILEHEDRGMMQLVRVVPNVSLTRHH